MLANIIIFLAAAIPLTLFFVLYVIKQCRNAQQAQDQKAATQNVTHQVMNDTIEKQIRHSPN
jgi:hypothetical protein